MWIIIFKTLIILRIFFGYKLKPNTENLKDSSQIFFEIWLLENLRKHIFLAILKTEKNQLA
jgi:hypothetical protein